MRGSSPGKLLSTTHHPPRRPRGAGPGAAIPLVSTTAFRHRHFAHKQAYMFASSTTFCFDGLFPPSLGRRLWTSFQVLRRKEEKCSEQRRAVCGGGGGGGEGGGRTDGNQGRRRRRGIRGHPPSPWAPRTRCARTSRPSPRRTPPASPPPAYPPRPRLRHGHHSGRHGLQRAAGGCFQVRRGRSTTPWQRGNAETSKTRKLVH